ncbi:glycosyltransferase family 2 protein [Candidatus Methylomirabilis sp.]|uniref:glycosyltransferase family 2 protein n=1 Tax=Candidatus Methylomirabilis sp. TaxID=2032687 RepID=UPI003C73FEDF
MDTSHRVTVLIPVYNREKYVAAAIESILAKSFIDFELLLIDDGSTDGSVKILRSHTT